MGTHFAFFAKELLSLNFVTDLQTLRIFSNPKDSARSSHSASIALLLGRRRIDFVFAVVPILEKKRARVGNVKAFLGAVASTNPL